MMGRLLLLTCFSLMIFSSHAAWKEELAQATRADADGKSEEAEKIYLELLKKHADESELWVAYGEHCRFYTHKFDRAEEAFERALKSPAIKDSVSAFAYRGLGELAVKKDDFASAKKYFQASLRNEPLVDTHRSLCHLYCREKNYRAASEHARAAVILVPDDAIALLLHATLLHRNGLVSEGKAAYQKAAFLSGLDEKGGKSIHCCVIYNAAGYLSVVGERAAALKMLARFLETPNHRHLSWAEIEEDADFDNIRTDSSFKRLKDRYFNNEPSAR